MALRMNSEESWCGVPAPDPSDFTVGLEYQLEDLKEILLREDDDEDMMIMPHSAFELSLRTLTLISAPPGCGKTKLTHMLCRDSAIQGRFKHIFFVPVSQRVNIKVIVQRIYQHKGYQLPAIANDEDALKQLKDLFKTLGPYPVLLVLDDVWSPGLESFVDKFMFRGIPGYKLVVTSRFEHPSFEPSIYRLQPLHLDNAKILFLHAAACTRIHALDAYVNQMVKACNGFPLALKVVGKSLSGMPRHILGSTMDEWSKGRSSILDFSRELLTQLGTSLHSLDDPYGMAMANECFLDLGSFPADQRIQATSLTDIWAELYGFDDEGMYTLDMLFQLASRNLVNFLNKRDHGGYFDGNCQGRSIMLHDMLRTLSVYKSKQESIEQRKRLIIERIDGDEIRNICSTENIHRPVMNARLLSISSTGNSFAPNWCDMRLPNVQVLILNLRTSNYSFPKLVNLIKLKALIVTNYGSTLAKISDFAPIGVLSGLKRIRLEHVSIPSLSKSTVRLMNLKKISFNLCKIGEASDSWANMFPRLEEIEIYCCPDLVRLPFGICDLNRLKKLMVSSCNELRELPPELGKLKSLLDLRLISCTKLIELPETIGNLHKLSTLDISNCVSMAKLPTRMGELHGLRKLYMRGCWGLFCDLPRSIRALEKLTVRIDEPKAYLWQDYDKVKVYIVKEDINLAWLHDLRKENLNSYLKDDFAFT